MRDMLALLELFGFVFHCTFLLILRFARHHENQATLRIFAWYARYPENEHLCLFLHIMHIGQSVGRFRIAHFVHFCSFLRNLELRHDRKTWIMWNSNQGNSNYEFYCPISNMAVQTCLKKSSNYVKLELWALELSEIDLYTEKLYS